MKMSIGLMVLVTISCVSLAGQTALGQTSQSKRLPSPEGPVNCEDILSYIDDALGKANQSNSNVISIIKMHKRTKTAVAVNRINNIRKYFVFRGFKNFEIAASFDIDDAERIELHVLGERLYSLPIERDDKLDLSVCVVGPDL